MTASIALSSTIALLALAAALHPFTTFPLSLWLLAALHKRPQAPRGPLAGQEIPMRTPPRIAICLCVHNEARVLARRLENLLDMTEGREDTEVLVYSDGSTDGTEQILRGFEGRVRVVAETARHGKTHGMNRLVALTDADVVVFTDAAVMMNDEALDRMLAHFVDPAVGCVCARILAVPPDTRDAPSATASTSMRYWAFDATVRQLETRVASVMGAHGPLFAIRRALHVAPPADLLDDFTVSMAILHNGHRVVQADDFIGYKAVAPKASDEFARKARIACQSFNAHRSMAAARARQTGLVRYLYASHKTLRWLTGYSLALAALAGSWSGVALGAAPWVAAAWVALALALALGRGGVRPFTLGYAAAAALAGTALGIWQSLRGRRYQTWSSPQSARQSG